MQLTVLGCHAATPRTLLNPTSQVLEIKNKLFLIDCAEGTQVQLRRCKLKFASINHIFISHLHGDHVFGLIGLISTFMLLNRKTDLHIFGPVGIKELITVQLRLTQSWTKFGLYFHELSSKESQLILDIDDVEVWTLPLHHRIYTNGFLFKEKVGLRKLDKQAALDADIHPAYFRNLTLGKDVVNEQGVLIDHKTVTFDAAHAKSYAFCSDTAYHPPLVDLIRGVDLLYHESTFLNSHAELATKTYHSTAQQAAQIAAAAEVKKLMLGHFSTRYSDLTPFMEEATAHFKAVILAKDATTYTL